MKKIYFCVDDYGTGGIWYLVRAESSTQITNRLPFLVVIESRPKWMEEEVYQRLSQTSSFDIENLPIDGTLGFRLQERMKEFESSGTSPISEDRMAEKINEKLKRWQK